MTWTRVLLLAIAMMASILFPGCIWFVGGNAAVSAYSVSDDYRYSRPDWGPGRVNPYPQKEKLTRLQRVVLITFYVHRWPSKRDFLHAIRVEGNRERVTYPSRFYPIVPFTIFGNACEIGYGAFVFAEDCWPAIFSVYGANGPSVLSHYHHDDMYPPPAGAEALIRPVLYRRSRQFEGDVAIAAGWWDNQKYDCLVLVLGKYRNDLIDVIDKSPDLTPADRVWVYKELFSLVENILELEMDERRKAVYQEAKKRVLEKIAEWSGKTEETGGMSLPKTPPGE